jgi:hypothetical protein
MSSHCYLPSNGFIGKRKSILLCVQMVHLCTDINEKFLHLPGGLQCILVDGYQTLLDFHKGLLYLQFQPHIKEELDTLPNLIMPSDIDWDPSSYDNIIENMDQFYDAKKGEVRDSPFDLHGNYCHCTIATHTLLGEL